MKAKECRPYVHRAIALTGGRVEWGDRRSPTWDGTTWHFARLQSEGDILHEIAHWVIAPAGARPLANYGLGTDPDEGPYTDLDLRPFFYAAGPEILRNVIDLAKRSPSTLGQILEDKASREEELAALVTVILMRLAGIAWAERMRRTYRGLLVDGDAGVEKFWGLVVELDGRGVDLSDPLAPFARAKEVAA